MWLIIVLFFFKQKTAYEMRISDWSSDVCSSDLPSTEIVPVAAHRQRGNADRAAKIEREYLRSLIATKLERHEGQKHRLAGAGWTHNQGVTDVADMNGKPERRSEEHTSELQSLMSISYAVFCLKQKNI